MFIIDFDDTLFDTAAFKQARKKALAGIGISNDQYEESYLRARNSDDGIMTYSDDRHADVLGEMGIDRAAALLALRSTTEHLPAFLLPGAREFLAFLKQQGQRCVLLSLGASLFQEVKVTGVGIADFFDDILYVDDTKEHVLRNMLSKVDSAEHVWFVNDKVHETQDLLTVFPTLKPMLRKSPTIEESVYEQSGLPYFHSLSEMQVYVGKELE